MWLWSVPRLILASVGRSVQQSRPRYVLGVLAVTRTQKATIFFLQIRMSVTSPAIATHASSQPSQSGASIGGRAAAIEGRFSLQFEFMYGCFCLADFSIVSDAQLLKHIDARMRTESQSLESRMQANVVQTVVILVVFQTLALSILAFVQRRSTMGYIVRLQV